MQPTIKETAALLEYGPTGLAALLMIIVLVPFMGGFFLLVKRLGSSIDRLADEIKKDRHAWANRVTTLVWETHDHISDVEERLTRHALASAHECRIGACRYGRPPVPPAEPVVPVPRYPRPELPTPAETPVSRS